MSEKNNTDENQINQIHTVSTESLKEETDRIINQIQSPTIHLKTIIMTTEKIKKIKESTYHIKML